jgi:predicted GNAT superfamily acetyltransferase
MVTHSSAIDIRAVKGTLELKAVEDLQKEIWRCSEREILPSLALIPLLEIGGVLIGAFDQDELIGFVLGFPGIEHGRLILHSDMLAVKPKYRSRGLGYKLKVAQRERALETGIDTITWTFDPLQSRNAHLNFAKLGVIADRYKVNYYGETSSFLHRTGTDRLWVKWLLDSERVKKKLESPNLPTALSSALEGLPALLRVSDRGEPAVPDERWEGAAVLEIPGNMSDLLVENSGLAIRWREASRRAFTSALDSGYTVVGFYQIERNGRNIGSYLARKPAGR